MEHKRHLLLVLAILHLLLSLLTLSCVVVVPVDAIPVTSNASYSQLSHPTSSFSTGVSFHSVTSNETSIVIPCSCSWYVGLLAFEVQGPTHLSQEDKTMEGELIHERLDFERNDYSGWGANNRHDPRLPGGRD